MINIFTGTSIHHTRHLSLWFDFRMLVREAFHRKNPKVVISVQSYRRVHAHSLTTNIRAREEKENLRDQDKEPSLLRLFSTERHHPFESRNESCHMGPIRAIPRIASSQSFWANTPATRDSRLVRIWYSVASASPLSRSKGWFIERMDLFKKK